MLPPRTVYSAAIRNRSGTEVTVVVSYQDAEDRTSTQEIVVPANGSATAPERTYERGSATFAMEISRVEIKASGSVGSSHINAPFPGVHSPTKEYPIDIIESNGALQLTTKYPE